MVILFWFVSGFFFGIKFPFSLTCDLFGNLLHGSWQMSENCMSPNPAWSFSSLFRLHIFKESRFVESCVISEDSQNDFLAYQTRVCFLTSFNDRFTANLERLTPNNFMKLDPSNWNRFPRLNGILLTIIINHSPEVWSIL